MGSSLANTKVVMKANKEHFEKEVSELRNQGYFVNKFDIQYIGGILKYIAFLTCESRYNLKKSKKKT